MSGTPLAHRPHRQVQEDLPQVVVGGGDDVIEARRRNLDALLVGDGHDGGLELLGAGSLETQVEAVTGERADLGVVAVVAEANDGNVGVFDELDELLYATPVLISRHAIHLIHQQTVPLDLASRRPKERDKGLVVETFDHLFAQTLLGAGVRGVQLHV